MKKDNSNIEKKNYHLSLLALVVSLAIGIPVLTSQVIYPYWHDNYAVENTGETYKNYPLNFQITKPSNDWSFMQDMIDIQKITGQNIPSTVLGGVVVQNPDKQGVSVFVISENDPDASDADHYAQAYMQAFKNMFPSAWYKISPSLDGKSVIVDSKDDPDNTHYSRHELIQKYGNKIYVLSEHFRYDQTLTNTTIAEITKTFESFEHLS